MGRCVFAMLLFFRHETFEMLVVLMNTCILLPTRLNIYFTMVV